jgi:hypothetical protein
LQEQEHQPLPQSIFPLAFAHSSFSATVGDPESLRSQMGVLVLLQLKLITHGVPLLGQGA